MKTPVELKKEYDEVCNNIEILLHKLENTKKDGGDLAEITDQLEKLLNKSIELRKILRNVVINDK